MWGFPHSSVGKESACNVGDPGLIPGSGRSPGEGNGNPLRYSCLENSMDRGAWQATVHGVAIVGHDLATKPPPQPLFFEMHFFIQVFKGSVTLFIFLTRKPSLQWYTSLCSWPRILTHLIGPQSPGFFLSHQGLTSCDCLFLLFVCFFKLWCWKRLLRVPWTAKRSNQLILNEINPDYSLEGLMLKLKLQYFGHLMWRADSLEKTLMLGKIEGRRGEEGDRGWEGWMASPTRWTWVWANYRW